MTKKKRTKVSAASQFLAKFLGIIILSGGFGILFYNCGSYFLSNSHYFQIALVSKDPALNFINDGNLEKLIGKNIFDVDLVDLQKNLLAQYPQVAQLRVVRRLPNQLMIVARQRHPFVEIQLKNRAFTLDQHGFILFSTPVAQGTLPVILGIKETNQRFAIGVPIQSEEMESALNIVRIFKSTPSLLSYQLSKIDIESLAKINLCLSNNLNVIIDSQRVEDKLKLLTFVLTHGGIRLEEIQYIDLRFQEPILSKKIDPLLGKKIAVGQSPRRGSGHKKD